GRVEPASWSQPTIPTSSTRPTRSSRCSRRCSGGEVEGQLDQQPGPEPGGATRQPSFVGVAVHRAGDVEVRPWRIAHEFAEEQRGDDRAAERSADVLHVGDVAVDQLAITALERQLPY